MTAGDARARAADDVAERFTRAMNAATSRYGVLTDFAVVSAVVAIPLVLMVRQAAAGDLMSPTTFVLAAMAVIPVLVSMVLGVALRGAREQVIDWIARQPFPVENVNALLVGLSDELEIQFDRSRPKKLLSREALSARVETVAPDAFATAMAADEMRAEVKIGIVESTRIPIWSTHLRWKSFQRIVEEVLVPLHAEHPIRAVRVRLPVPQFWPGAEGRATAAR
jgi:hypothetical protein